MDYQVMKKTQTKCVLDTAHKRSDKALVAFL